DPAEGKGETKGPGNAALIARYTAILLAQPASPFPLQRLAQLYRERDGNLKGLVTEFEHRAHDPGPEQWQATVALAGIYLAAGRRRESESAAAASAETVAAASGDNRALAPALRDLGRALAKEHKNADALATLKTALAAAGGEAGVRGEIFTVITEVYRSENDL